MRRLAAAAVLLAACGVNTRKCKQGTVFATLRFDGISAADSLDVALSVDGAATEHTPVTRTGGGTTSTLEIDFDSYPTGKTIDITVVASQGTSEVGRGHASMPLMPGCTSLEIDIMGEGVDLSGGDFAAVDLAAADGAAQPDLTAVDLACPIIYVSTSGDNAHDGCTPATAVASISHGELIAAGHEVHVCAGTYSESSLAAVTSLFGGYSCSTWTRTANYGYPTFDGVNETIVTNGSYPTSVSTMTVPAPGNVVIDGFTIEGAASGTTGAIAANVLGGPTVTNNKILGGGTSSTTGMGSTAMKLGGSIGTVMPDIHNNSINGGTGSSSAATFDPSCGSIGVAVTDASAHVHDNTINGGSGSGTGMAAGSCAVWLNGNALLTAATGLAFERNIVNGGSGSGSATFPGATFGLLVHIDSSGNDIDILDNQLDAGHSSDGHPTQAVYAGGRLTLNIRRNRIFGGVGNGTTALQVIGTGNPTTNIEDNMIQVGQPSGTGAADGISIGVNGVSVRHNTVIAGNVNAASRQAAVHIVGALTGITVANNILAGTGSGNGVAVLADNTGSILSMRNNVSFQVGSLLTEAGTSYTSDQTMQAAKSYAIGNLNLSSTCSADSGCIVVAGCTGGPNCTTALFGAWDSTTNGVTDLFSTGWKLTSAIPCSVSKSSVDDTTIVSVDLFGTARTNPPSMGAHEYDGTCQ